MNGLTKRSIALALAAGLCSGAALAQDGEGAPEMTAEQAAMMQAWMDAGTPGDPHERLASQAGEWTADMEMWMDPDAPPSQVTYSVKRSMQLDGRVLHEEWSGEWMGQPFHGISRTGYDNITDTYWSTWSDNMSTTLMMTTGSMQDDGSIEMTGKSPNPMTGEMMPNRFVWRFPDDGTEIMEAYETRDGEETMTMRMTLSRAGS